MTFSLTCRPPSDVTSKPVVHSERPECLTLDGHRRHPNPTRLYIYQIHGAFFTTWKKKNERRWSQPAVRLVSVTLFEGLMALLSMNDRMCTENVLSLFAPLHNSVEVGLMCCCCASTSIDFCQWVRGCFPLGKSFRLRIKLSFRPPIYSPWPHRSCYYTFITAPSSRTLELHSTFTSRNFERLQYERPDSPVILIFFNWF